VFRYQRRCSDTNWSTILYLIRFTLKLYHAKQLRVDNTSAPPRGLAEPTEHSASSQSPDSDHLGEPEAKLAAQSNGAFMSAGCQFETSERVLTPLSAASDAATALPSPNPDMVVELLRWTYDRLYSLAHPPQERALRAKSRAKSKGKGKGKARAAEVESDSDEDRKRVAALPKRERGFLLGLLELVRLSRAENVPLPSSNAGAHDANYPVILR
jgi:hypothetical protein